MLLVSALGDRSRFISVSSKLTTILQVLGQPWLHSKTLILKKNYNKILSSYGKRSRLKSSALSLLVLPSHCPHSWCLSSNDPFNSSGSELMVYSPPEKVSGIHRVHLKELGVVLCVLVIRGKADVGKAFRLSSRQPNLLGEFQDGERP